MIWWWGSSNAGALGNAEYPFIVITPRSTLAQGGSKKTVLFQTIRFSIRTQFSSIWTIDRALSGATTPGQSGPESDVSEKGTPHSRGVAIRLLSFIIRTLVGGSYSSAEMQCILQPQLTGLEEAGIWTNIYIYRERERDMNRLSQIYREWWRKWRLRERESVCMKGGIVITIL